MKKLGLYKIPLLLGGISIFAIALSILLLVTSVQTTQPIQFSSDSASESSVLGVTDLKIDIEGAVAHPGLYSLPEGSRVEDAITAAGGITAEVDQELFAKTINRAMKLVDGGKIFVPVVGASSDLGSTGSVSTLISINAGTEGQLDALSGVGPVTAKKIIDNRPYQTLEELVSKKAVSQSVFEKIKTQLSL